MGARYADLTQSEWQWPEPLLVVAVRADGAAVPELGDARYLPVRRHWDRIVGVVLSVSILSHVDWPSDLAPGVAGLVVILLVAASPLLVVHRSSPFRPPDFG